MVGKRLGAVNVGNIVGCKNVGTAVGNCDGITVGNCEGILEGVAVGVGTGDKVVVHCETRHIPGQRCRIKSPQYVSLEHSVPASDARSTHSDSSIQFAVGPTVGFDVGAEDGDGVTGLCVGIRLGDVDGDSEGDADG